MVLLIGMPPVLRLYVYCAYRVNEYTVQIVGCVTKVKVTVQPDCLDACLTLSVVNCHYAARIRAI
jgi:hypothetical protein